MREAAGEVSATVSTNLGGLTTIKAFTAEQREVERVSQVSDAYREANRTRDPQPPPRSSR